MYRVVKPLLFSLPPETSHRAVLGLLTHTPLADLLACATQREFPNLERKLFGLTFPNPVGLAAGFDKNAEGITTWPKLGFGFSELGTVTPLPQPGNPSPRIFRLPHEECLINRMGFPSLGVDAVVRRLERVRASGRWPKAPVGLNLGKNKSTAITDAGSDYLKCFRRVKGLADYYVVNVSSPNTPGLRDLQQGKLLDSILEPLRWADTDCKHPLLIKIAPDLSEEHLEGVVDAVIRYRLDGIIATNTTTDKRGLSLQEEGGASGRVLTERSTDTIRQLSRLTRGNIPLIGVGGIFSAADAKAKLDAGASLIQIYTGLIYQGPSLPRQICEGLVSGIS